jgi:dihydrofolate reductase
MTISLIVAASENNVIGKNNTIPWRLPADIKFFKDKTMGHCIITGRKNYESIPEKYRPLPGRTNIVITRNKELHIIGAIVVNSIDAAIKEAEMRKETECFIIGGGEIFRQALNRSGRIYLTRIHQHFEGDVFFPELNKAEWKEITHTNYPADEKNPYPFTIYVLERIRL